MNRNLLRSVGVLFLFCSVSGLAQETQAPPSSTAPAGQSLAAATRSEIECAGFFARRGLASDMYVSQGADNDFQFPLHEWTAGNFVYLKGRADVTIGTEYAIVRPASRLFRFSWYGGQGWSMQRLGRPYEDVGRVRVTSLTREAAVAQVTFACGPIATGDIAVPYEPRQIPEYMPQVLDRFAPANGKRAGTITVALNNAGYLGTGSIAYLSLGSRDGVHPGQRLRVFHIFRDRVARWSLFSHRRTPRESLGEVVVLLTEDKSSTAIVVTSWREITVGDGVEIE